jgi:hypothetical protein
MRQRTDCDHLAREVLEAVLDAEEIKANLIKMRKYLIFHQIGIGECCAWNRLKEAFGVGQTTDEADWAWLDAYEKLQELKKNV